MFLVPRKSNSLWDQFKEMEQLQREMNRLFDFSLARLPGEDSTLSGGQWAPAIDVHDSKDNILVQADLPGLKKEEIEVTVENDTLVIKGEKKQEAEVKEKNHYRAERFYGSFFRSIVLPSAVDASKIDASYRDGVLKLVLPKKEEAKPKQIKIDVK